MTAQVRTLDDQGEDSEVTHDIRVRNPKPVTFSDRDVIRFRSKTKAGSVPTHAPHLGVCLVWTGLTVRAYGQFSIGARRVAAHRFAWEIANGAAGGLLVLHRCDNPLCVKAEHLFLGTNEDNMRDMVSKGRAARGERASNRKFSETDVVTIRARLASGEARAAIARDYGVDKTAIGLIHRRSRWAHV